MFVVNYKVIKHMFVVNYKVSKHMFKIIMLNRRYLSFRVIKVGTPTGSLIHSFSPVQRYNT